MNLASFIKSAQIPNENYGPNEVLLDILTKFNCISSFDEKSREILEDIKHTDYPIFDWTRVAQMKQLDGVYYIKIPRNCVFYRPILKTNKLFFLDELLPKTGEIDKFEIYKKKMGERYELVYFWQGLSLYLFNENNNSKIFQPDSSEIDYETKIKSYFSSRNIEIDGFIRYFDTTCSDSFCSNSITLFGSKYMFSDSFNFQILVSDNRQIYFTVNNANIQSVRFNKRTIIGNFDENAETNSIYFYPFPRIPIYDVTKIPGLFSSPIANAPKEAPYYSILPAGYEKIKYYSYSDQIRFIMDNTKMQNQVIIDGETFTSGKSNKQLLFIPFNFAITIILTKIMLLGKKKTDKMIACQKKLAKMENGIKYNSGILFVVENEIAREKLVGNMSLMFEKLSDDFNLLLFSKLIPGISGDSSEKSAFIEQVPWLFQEYWKTNYDRENTALIVCTIKRINTRIYIGKRREYYFYYIGKNEQEKIDKVKKKKRYMGIDILYYIDFEKYETWEEDLKMLYKASSFTLYEWVPGKNSLVEAIFPKLDSRAEILVENENKVIAVYHHVFIKDNDRFVTNLRWENIYPNGYIDIISFGSFSDYEGDYNSLEREILTYPIN